jgi:hypothetical protein
MDILTTLYTRGRVELVLDMRNARPAFTPPADTNEATEVTHG